MSDLTINRIDIEHIDGYNLFEPKEPRSFSGYDFISDLDLSVEGLELFSNYIDPKTAKMKFIYPSRSSFRI